MRSDSRMPSTLVVSNHLRFLRMEELIRFVRAGIELISNSPESSSASMEL